MSETEKNNANQRSKYIHKMWKRSQAGTKNEKGLLLDEWVTIISRSLTGFLQAASIERLAYAPHYTRRTFTCNLSDLFSLHPLILGFLSSVFCPLPARACTFRLISGLIGVCSCFPL